MSFPIGSFQISNPLTSTPLELLLEIFEQVTPADLLNLARTQRTLRVLLLQRRHADVWAKARSCVPDLPPCPPDLSEPAYASLVFDAVCHKCWKEPVALDEVVWQFHARLCPPCTSKAFTNNYYDHFSHSIMHHLPIFSGPTTRAGPLYVTLSNDYTNFRSTLKRMRGPEHVVRRDKFLSETRARKLVLEEHALHCEIYVTKTLSRANWLHEIIRQQRLRSYDFYDYALYPTGLDDFVPGSSSSSDYEGSSYALSSDDDDDDASDTTSDCLSSPLFPTTPPEQSTQSTVQIQYTLTTTVLQAPEGEAEFEDNTAGVYPLFLQRYSL